jgi:hypothetical protein
VGIVYEWEAALEWRKVGRERDVDFDADAVASEVVRGRGDRRRRFLHKLWE